jgi:hypothetical protein
MSVHSACRSILPCSFPVLLLAREHRLAQSMAVRTIRHSTPVVLKRREAAGAGAACDAAVQRWRNTISPSSCSRWSLSRTPASARRSRLASVALRTSSGSGRRSRPSSSSRSKANRNTVSSARRSRRRSNAGRPSSPQAVARQRPPPASVSEWSDAAAPAVIQGVPLATPTEYGGWHLIGFAVHRNAFGSYPLRSAARRP